MKNNIILGIILSVSLGFVYAQNIDVNVLSVEEKPQNKNIRNPGITPESPFFFLDLFGEKLKEVFTLNKPDKTRLQAKFAGERVAEIKVLLAKDGDHLKGIQRDEAIILERVLVAKEFLKISKDSGNNVALLSKELNDSFDFHEKDFTSAIMYKYNQLLSLGGSSETYANNLKAEKDSTVKSLRENKKGIVDYMLEEDQDYYNHSIEQYDREERMRESGDVEEQIN